jgi:VPDSG-CTERM motif
MKTLIFAAIRCSLMFTAVTAPLFCVRPAQAYTVTLEQIGSNVLATGSGAFNLAGLTSGAGFFTSAQIAPDIALITTGSPLNNFFSYFGTTGPTSFGSGAHRFASSGSGDLAGISGVTGFLLVPLGYVSGTTLSSRATWNNETFASLGVTPGTYVWSWGTGLPNQNFTLIIEGAGVPDGGSTVSLLGFASLGLVALRRKLGC